MSAYLLEQLRDDTLEALHNQRVWGRRTLAYNWGVGVTGLDGHPALRKQVTTRSGMAQSPQGCLD